MALTTEPVLSQSFLSSILKPFQSAYQKGKEFIQQKIIQPVQQKIIQPIKQSWEETQKRYETTTPWEVDIAQPLRQWWQSITTPKPISVTPTPIFQTPTTQKRIEEETQKAQKELALTKPITPIISTTTLTPTITPTTLPSITEPKTEPKEDLWTRIQDLVSQSTKSLEDIYQKQLESIKSKYEDYQKQLETKHAAEQEALIGEMAARGFGTGSGVTQGALNELRKIQESEIADLISKRAEEELAISKELANIKSQYPKEMREWLSFMKPEIIGGSTTGYYSYNPYTGEMIQVIPPVEETTKPQIITHSTGIYEYDPKKRTLTKLTDFPEEVPEKEKDVQTNTMEGLNLLSDYLAGTDYYVDTTTGEVKLKPGGNASSWKNNLSKLREAVGYYLGALEKRGVQKTDLDKIRKTIMPGGWVTRREVETTLTNLLQSLNQLVAE